MQVIPYWVIQNCETHLRGENKLSVFLRSLLFDSDDITTLCVSILKQKEMSQQYSPPASFVPPQQAMSSPFAPLPSLSPAQQQQFTPSFGTPPLQQFTPPSQFAPGDVKRISSLSSSPPKETKGLPLSLSSEEGQVTDIRPYLHLQIDVGAEDLNMTEEELENFYKAIREFFNPDNTELLSLISITVGKEQYRIPGNPAVMAAYSNIMLPLAESWGRGKLALFPPIAKDLSISLSPKAFVSAWIYVNGLTSDLWNWENTITDNAMLFLWLRALGVDLDRIEYLAEWMSGVTSLFSKNYGKAGVRPYEDYEVKVKPDAVSEEEWKALTRPRFIGGPPEHVVTNRVSNPIDLNDTERKLLTAVYEDLAPICQRTIDNGFSDQGMFMCQTFDEFADVLGKPRLEFRLRQMAHESRRDFGAPRNDPRVRPDQKEIKFTPFMPLQRGVDNEVNLSSYKTFGRYADVNAAIILSIDPGYASSFYPTLKVGEEKITVYGNPVVMSTRSGLFERLFERSVDTTTYPMLASNIKLSESPRAFVAVWLYLNGVDDSFGENLSVVDRIQMWEWMNYFDVKPERRIGDWLSTIVYLLSDRAGIPRFEGYPRESDESKLDELKLSEGERKALLTVHARLLPRCKRALENIASERTYRPDPLCDEVVIRRLENILKIAPESRIKILSYVDRGRISDELVAKYRGLVSLILKPMMPEQLKRIISDVLHDERPYDDPYKRIMEMFPLYVVPILSTLNIPYTVDEPTDENKRRIETIMKGTRGIVDALQKFYTEDQLRLMAERLGIESKVNLNDLRINIYKEYIRNPYEVGRLMEVWDTIITNSGAAVDILRNIDPNIVPESDPLRQLFRIATYENLGLEGMMQ